MSSPPLPYVYDKNKLYLNRFKSSANNLHCLVDLRFVNTSYYSYKNANCNDSNTVIDNIVNRYLCSCVDRI